MKPHIYKLGGKWWCYSKAFFSGNGENPTKAYEDWLARN